MYQGKHSSGYTLGRSRGKYSRRRTHRSKGLALLLSIALISVGIVSGVVAWLFTNTDSVVNQFTPGKVTVEVQETLTDNVKSDVKIQNTGNTDAFIRAAVIVTWKDADGNVYGMKPVAGTDYTITYSNTGWTQYDGYWYCNTEIPPNAVTPVLIQSCSPVAGTAPEGYALSVEILASGIQSKPTSVAQENWGYVPGNPGSGE